MDVKTALQKFKELQEKLSAYNHAQSIIFYDGVTTAPKGTTANRGQTLSVLSKETYVLSTGAETIELLEFLDCHKDELDHKQKRAVEVALKDIRDMQKIPMDEYVAYQQLLVEADDVWHTAKETSDFELFCPYLKKIFETERKFAKYCAPDMHPYDYCLDKYEKGLTRQKCDEFFSALKEELVPLIKQISSKPQISNDCLIGDFADDRQHKFSIELMKTMGIDLNHCGLATTEHPFTTSFGSHYDVRITTNFKRDDFSSSMFSVIHEGGHALYDMGSADELAYTFLDGGVSMGIHESQSRFYENILGRSKHFINFIFPKICECFPEQMKGYTADDVYKAVNLVTPSLIRTEADEVTYSLHVMVRYELEKRIMSGELEVEDLPSEGNRLYKEYLGVDVPDDKHGVLQDSHWSGGGIGYFPSYALGSAYGAQFLLKMKETVDVEHCLSTGDFAPINEWNKENIWKHGCLYEPNELLDRILGEPFTPKAFIDYLKNKYKKIYNL
jgi:carboxypeptidase Taq